MKHQDPVWGMTVEEGKESAESKYEGTTFFFCSRGCKVAFEKDTENVLKGSPTMKMPGH